MIKTPAAQQGVWRGRCYTQQEAATPKMSGGMHAGVSWLKGCRGPQAGTGAWARSTLQGQETERAEVLRLGTVFCIQKATGTRIRLEGDVKEPWGWRSQCGQGPRPDWAGAIGGFQLTLQKASGAHEGTSGAATLSTRTDGKYVQARSHLHSKGNLCSEARVLLYDHN